MSHHARLGFVQSCCHPRSADAPAHGLSQDRVPRVAFLGFLELAKAELSSEQYRLCFLWFLTNNTWNFRFQLESNKIMIAFLFRQQPWDVQLPQMSSREVLALSCFCWTWHLLKPRPGPLCLPMGLAHKGASSSGAKEERLEVVAFIFGVHKYVFNTRRSRWNTVVLQRVLQKCFEYYRNSMDYKQDVIFT